MTATNGAAPAHDSKLPGDPFQVRIHGRGGQGVVTAAELLASAAFLDGHEAQAFPSFGSERMGAPVVSFCRIATHPVRVREPVTAPDAVMVLDATLLHHVEVFDGLAPGGFALISSVRSTDELGLDALLDIKDEHLAVVPATSIARRLTGAPRPNVPALAALAALTGACSLNALTRAVENRFGSAGATSADLLCRAGFDAAARVSHA